jgi:LuxR family maltose regulon positive regulatory protein
MEREAPLRELSADGAFRLVLLRAPAGYGKTALLRAAHARRARAGAHVAWLNLDHADNDPATLRRSLHAALRVAPAPAPGDDAQLASSSVTHLYLDAVEQLDGEAIRSLFSLIAGILPPSMRVYLAARSLHHGGVAALKVAGTLVELDMDDLQFSPAETASYLRQQNIDIPPDDVALLQRISEGWPAAIALIAPAWKKLRRHGGADTFILSALPEFNDYLQREVLGTLDEPVRRLLATAAPLATFCAGLLEAALGHGDSELQMAWLQSAGLPLRQLPDGWLRCHPLLASHLALRQPAPSAVYAKAGSWLARQHHVEQAIDCFLMAGAHAQAADALESVIAALCAGGQFERIVHCCEQLPTAMLQQRPALSGALLVGLLCTARGSELANWLHFYRRRSALAGADPRYAASLDGIAPLLAFLAGDTDRCIALAEKHKSRTTMAAPAPADPRHLAAYTCLWRGELAEAALLLVAARRDCAASGSPIGMALVGFLQAYLDAIGGNFEAALQQLAAADALAQQHAEQIPPFLFHGYSVGLALLIAYEHNRLDLVTARLALARSLPAAGLPWDAHAAVLVMQARMLALQQGQAAARLWLDAACRQGRARLPAPARALLEAEQSRMALQAGNHDAVSWHASILLQPVWAGDERCILPSQEIDGAGIAQARLMIRLGPVPEAAALIGRLLTHALATGRRWRATKLRVLLAIAMSRLGKAREAEAEMVLALEQAAASGMLRLFLDEGSDALGLLRIMRGKARRLLSTRAATHLDVLLRGADAPSIAPLPAAQLTPTESTLLALVALGRTNGAIAEQLDLSVNTVKWHLGQIFRKLSVSNRGQAVCKARRVGVLPMQ